jgi:cyd operon protein YbgT
MWYFSWLLGLPLAAAFAVLNAMWYELIDDEAKKKAAPVEKRTQASRKRSRRPATGERSAPGKRAGSSGPRRSGQYTAVGGEIIDSLSSRAVN